MNTTISRFDPALLDSAPLRPCVKIRRPSKQLKFGSITVPYQEYRNTGGRYWMLFYYHAGVRRRECRSSFAALKSRAKEVADAIANGQAAMNSFSEADRASHLRALELLRPTGKTLELAVSEFAEALALLNPSTSSTPSISLLEAVRFFLENRPRGFVPRPLPELVEIFLDEKEPEICAAWHAQLAHHLRRMARWYTGPLHGLQSAAINTWLRGLKDAGGKVLGARARRNHRSALDQLVRWAQANNHLPRTWAEMEHVTLPEARILEIRILTPRQGGDLLRVRQQAEEMGRARKSLVPFLALQMFAGLRHAEVNRLDWRHIHLEDRHLFVPKSVGKARRDRAVPISDNLAAWLTPYARTSGPLVNLVQTSGALTKAKVAAGIPAGENETHNILRHSFISYRKAVTHNIAQVAEEAGNSPGIIRKHYEEPVSEAEGKKWFDLWPTTAEVLQLNFAGL